MKSPFLIRESRIYDPKGAQAPVLREVLAKRLSLLPGLPTGLIMELDLAQPLVDLNLATDMIGLCHRSGRSVVSEGAVPGTSPLLVRRDNPSPAPPITCHTGTQSHYNSQLDVRRGKRLKVFLSLLKRFPDLPTWDLTRILDYLGSEDGTRLVLSYGEEIRWEPTGGCPHCRQNHGVWLPLDGGQSVIGFLTRSSPVYRRCHPCGLVYLDPQPSEADLPKFYDHWDLEGEATLQDPSTASYREHFHIGLTSLAQGLPPSARILDLGGGTGAFARLARRQHPGWTVEVADHRAPPGDLGSEGIKAHAGDFTRMNFGRGTYDLVTLWEVVEHLRFERLLPLLKSIRGWLQPGGRLIISTPDFEAPSARAAEFWAAFPPHHLTVLSESVLEPLWIEAGFSLRAKGRASLATAEGAGWVSYQSRCAPSMGHRAEATLLSKILGSKSSGPMAREVLSKEGQGSEMILCLEALHSE
ncbi:MAG: class I SAM-dependent methyltransferase [Planctomycetota bacterium]